MNFGDVVWTGLSTKHIRASFPESFTQEDLRQYWAVISPETYLDRMAERKMKSLLIWGKYDTTFLPEYSRKVVEYFRSRQLTHRVICLPCGHYTLGQFPFNIMDGISMCMFLRRNL
jgi:pimeloyl-ACP methyl ester carboxylesterase